MGRVNREAHDDAEVIREAIKKARKRGSRLGGLLD